MKKELRFFYRNIDYETIKKQFDSTVLGIKLSIIFRYQRFQVRDEENTY